MESRNSSSDNPCTFWIQRINVVIFREYDFRICVFQAEQDSFQFGSKSLYVVDAIVIF